MEATDAKRNHNQLRRAARVRPPAPLPGGLGGAGGWAVGGGLCGAVGAGLTGLHLLSSAGWGRCAAGMEDAVIWGLHLGRNQCKEWIWE